MDRNFERYKKKEELIKARAAADAILYRAELGDRIEFNPSGRPIINIYDNPGGEIFVAASQQLGGINEFEIPVYLESFGRALEALLEQEK